MVFCLCFLSNSQPTLFFFFPLLNSGQSNYGWANSVCERVAAGRVRDGLPGVAIQWGGVGDVGVLADTLGEIEVHLLFQFRIIFVILGKFVINQYCIVYY